MNASGRRIEPCHPRDQLALVGVRAEPVEALHLGAHADRLTEHVHEPGAVPNPAAQGAFGLESDHQDRIAGIAEPVA